MRVARRAGAAGRAASAESARAARGALESRTAGAAGVCGVLTSNRLRNWSSRKRGVRGTRSMRATCDCSVRCPLTRKSAVPSALHFTSPVNAFGRKLTWRGSPVPSARATNALANPRSPARAT